MKTEQQADISKVWDEFHKTHSEQSRNMLMEHYTYLVKYTAERLFSKLPDKIELDDLISAGLFGLMDAIDAFDPERGVKFETYGLPLRATDIVSVNKEIFRVIKVDHNFSAEKNLWWMTVDCQRFQPISRDDIIKFEEEE